MSGNGTPLISFIVPVFNAQSTLRDCLASLERQTGDDLEFLLIDDGSSDEGPAMLDAFARKDARARVIHKENGGVAAARNDGLAIAAGRFLCFLDSDDLLDDALVARTRPLLNETRDIVCFSWKSFSRADASDRERDMPSGVHECTEAEARLICLNTLCPAQSLAKTPMRFRGSRGVWGFIIRADIVKRKGVRFRAGMKLAEDVAFRLEAISGCTKIACVGDVLYHYRISSTSLLHGYNADVKRDVFLAIQTLREIVRDAYRDSPEMRTRYASAVILESRYYLLKYLFHKQCPLGEQEKIKLYEAFRREDVLTESIERCDRAQLQSPIDKLLDAYRVQDAARSYKAARAALTDRMTLKALAKKLGVATLLRRLAGR